MLQGFVISSYVLSLKTILTVIYNQMITRNRYIRDTYKELDISELPPGEVLQTSWNGEMIFVRRLTKSEVDQTNALPPSTELDKVSKVGISDAGNSSIVCCSNLKTLYHLEQVVSVSRSLVHLNPASRDEFLEHGVN